VLNISGVLHREVKKAMRFEFDDDDDDDWDNNDTDDDLEE
jgi:hypothetical protein